MKKKLTPWTLLRSTGDWVLRVYDIFDDSEEDVKALHANRGVPPGPDGEKIRRFKTVFRPKEYCLGWNSIGTFVEFHFEAHMGQAKVCSKLQEIFETPPMEFRVIT